MTDIPYPPHGILTVRRVGMRRSFDVSRIVYIPFALDRSGVAIFAKRQSRPGPTYSRTAEADTHRLRWVTNEKGVKSRGFVDGRATDFACANVRLVLESPRAALCSKLNVPARLASSFFVSVAVGTRLPGDERRFDGDIG